MLVLAWLLLPSRVLERQGDMTAARQFRAAMESFMLTVSNQLYVVAAANFSKATKWKASALPSINGR